MKVFPIERRSLWRGRSASALSLAETMVAMGVFSLVVVGLMYTFMFGMRLDELVQSKLGASDSSRRGFSSLADDIRASKSWRVGYGGASSFNAITNGKAQVGTAVQLYPTTATNTYTRYYFDTNKFTLNRVGSGATNVTKIAQYLTNAMYFLAETYQGATQTDLSHKGVVYARMEFAQYQYPLTKVGPSNLYDYYRLEFRLTSHIPDGP